MPSIVYYNKKGTNISFSYNAKKNSEIVLPLFNYPGYTAEDQTGKKIKIEENDNQMILIKLPKGTGTVKVWYKGLVLFTVADCLSVYSCRICFIVCTILGGKTTNDFIFNKIVLVFDYYWSSNNEKKKRM